MKKSQLINILRRIEREIEHRRFSSAIEQLVSMSEAAGAPWSTRSEIEKLQESYGFLRGYALAGVTDPSRNEMLASITAGIRNAATSIIRYSEIAESHRQYFGIIRFEQMQPDSSIQNLVEQYTVLLDRLSLAEFSNKQGQVVEVMRRQADSLADRLFNLVWVTYPLSSDDADTLSRFFADEQVPEKMRVQILGAVLLGALEYFDERRMQVLAKAYLVNEQTIEMHAIVALAISMWMNRDLIHGRSFSDVMATVREKSQWHDDIKMVFLNLVRTRDTDRISRTLKEEVIPQMMKLRPEVFKKFNEMESPEDISSIEDNPEWEEMLEKSGITDKLKELNDLQSEGADVMLSTFAGLKSFSFFSNVSHWFLPFFTEQVDASKVLGDSAEDLGDIISMAPMLCDSDKYSIVFSLEQLPSANRRMMLKQFKAQSDQIAELRCSMLNADRKSRNDIANNYIHNLYRFFTLYRRKGEFKNPFESPVNLASVALLASDLNEADTLEAVAEFYFKRNYYSEALDIFLLLISQGSDKASLYQKAGYCYQKLGELDKALAYYRRSELLTPESQWNMRRMAQCLRLLGRHSEALPYYARLAEQKPSDINPALNLGHCYLATGHYKEALQCYHKVEYLDEKGERALRPIAWCSFVEGDYVKASKYFSRIFSGKPVDTDYMNRGHLMLALGEYKKASEDYRSYLECNDGNFDKLDEAIKKDMPYLEKAGIDPMMIALTVDAAIYPENKL